eukprot:gnl/TRDRNA2_/TRDRNA2_131691_c0_seq1.p1 gnl/TRDRNA2_/TRDRNA2_131691_c0~~gnl/TRDRNA2_/TRDRNA2_131691_c0_seq1.p1  ORF type:complete len:202 (-),score=37.21 gnl/TRDRNA2_/TRDRNA2_131691_c0_seq1:99-704(-)
MLPIGSAVAIANSAKTRAIPNSLWEWMETDVYAYEGLMHAMICSRPAFLYQRLVETAPLHGLVQELFPSSTRFWISWVLAPQWINIKILDQHFTAHTWLNRLQWYMQWSSLISMYMTPKDELKRIGVQVPLLMGCWFFRWAGHKVFSEGFITWWMKCLGYGQLVCTGLMTAGLAVQMVTLRKMVQNLHEMQKPEEESPKDQ